MIRRVKPAGRPGRPRAGEARLSREAILAAGLRIVDADGLAALTMRRLADELGVNPMSLYHHLPGKAAVVAGLVELVFSEVAETRPVEGVPWQEQLRHAAGSYRRALRAHPHLALQIISDPVAVSAAVVASGEPFYAALERAGLPPASIMEAVNTIVDFVHGFLLGEVSSTGSGSFELAEPLLDRVRALPAGAAPALTRVAQALGETGLRYEFDGGFDAGIRLLIAGIEATAAPPPRRDRES